MERLETSYRVAFWYSFPVSTLSSGGNDVQSLTIAQDSTFEWWKTYISCSVDTDTDFNPNNVQVQFQDQSSGRFLSSAELPQRIIAPPLGDNLFPDPVVFAPGSVITCAYTDLSASSNNVTVALWGYKNFGG